MNHMADVAAMFGKKLNEQFCVRWKGVIVRVSFVSNGMKYYDNMCEQWYLSNNYLGIVLTGEAEIVEE